MNAVAVQSDGKIILAGNFSEYNGNTSYHNLPALNADGSLDTTYLANASQNIYYGLVYAIVLQPDGKCIVGTTRTISTAAHPRS